MKTQWKPIDFDREWFHLISCLCEQMSTTNLVIRLPNPQSKHHKSKIKEWEYLYIQLKIQYVNKR